ncbi:MAG: hypothetical protein K9G67_04490 [Bacteroidales bacterium]|nr:hypothetical protein [Bacteroidales bacterium]MCF8375591.1 hypothetical protein [Bacteroidales bacterium]
MKVSGFSFIRNALRFDYPIVEAIRSVLPLCDEFVIAVGNSEDETLQLIQDIKDPRIRIIETVWNDSLRAGGRVLALETDKAFDAISGDSDWAFYIQGDEVLHEKYHKTLRKSMKTWLDNPKVEGLLFRYLHFYGSYDFIGDSRRWYRHEVRIIRNDKNIRSYRDAQGFRKNGKPLKVKETNASMYHYGWVKPPELQQAKQKSFHKFWHDDEWVNKNIPETANFDYSKIDSLKRFEGSHPELMKEKIKKKNWQFDFDPSKKRFSMKSRLLHFLEKKTGWRIGEYKNYRKL